MKKMRYIFILGTGRVGTTFIANFFNRNFKYVWAMHEANRRIKIACNKRLSGELSTAQLKNILEKYRDNVVLPRTAFPDIHVYIEANSWLVGGADILTEVFPSASFIHIVRDPATYIPSHLNRIYSHRFSGYLRNTIPYWLLRGDLVGDYTSAEWRSLHHEERMAWFWFKANSFISEALQNYPKAKRFRYEDIFDESNSGLKEMMKFIEFSSEDNEGIIQLTQRINKTKSSKFHHVSKWTSVLRKNVYSICRPLLSNYGYSQSELGGELS